MDVTRNLACGILPILLRDAAAKLEASDGQDPRRLALALDLRDGKAGGNAIEGLAQQTDDEGHETFPEALGTGWRVLVAFEEVALAGHLLRGGKISPLRCAVEGPHPWMLHAAADVIEQAASRGDRAAREMTDVVAAFRSVAIPPYRRLAHPMDTRDAERGAPAGKGGTTPVNGITATEVRRGPGTIRACAMDGGRNQAGTRGEWHEAETRNNEGR